MVEVRKYRFPPTKLIPNSPLPLLHYPGFLSGTADDPQARARKVADLFTSNGWQVQWLVRYGATQRSHYHSGVHECMAVLSGTATVRFGVADLDDIIADTKRSAQEEGGIELEALAGDVFIIPAGVAHKTHHAQPAAELLRLTPGDGHEDVTNTLEDIFAHQKIDGFTMLGAYPVGLGTWDFAVGGENAGNFDKVWSVTKPELDPVLGRSEEGLCGLWRQESDKQPGDFLLSSQGV